MTNMIFIDGWNKISKKWLKSWGFWKAKHMMSQEDFLCGYPLKYCRRPIRSGSFSNIVSGESTEERTEDDAQRTLSIFHDNISKIH